MHDSRQGPERHGPHMGLRRTSSRRVLDVLREQTTIEQLWDYLDECTPTCVIMNESAKRPFDGPRGEGCSRAGHQQETLCVLGGREQRCIWYSELETSEAHAWCVFGQASGCCLGMSCSATRQLMATIWKFLTTIPALVARVHRRCAGTYLHSLKCRVACAEWWSRVLAKREIAKQVNTKCVRSMTSLIMEKRGISSASLRRLHVILGHPKKYDLMHHLRHAHATNQALEATKQCECPACGVAKFSKVIRHSYPTDVQPPLKSIAIDVKELPGGGPW